MAEQPWDIEYWDYFDDPDTGGRDSRYRVQQVFAPTEQEALNRFQADYPTQENWVRDRVQAQVNKDWLAMNANTGDTSNTGNTGNFNYYGNPNPYNVNPFRSFQATPIPNTARYQDIDTTKDLFTPAFDPAKAPTMNVNPADWLAFIQNQTPAPGMTRNVTGQNQFNFNPPQLPRFNPMQQQLPSEAGPWQGPSAPGMPGGPGYQGFTPYQQNETTSATYGGGTGFNAFDPALDIYKTAGGPGEPAPAGAGYPDDRGIEPYVQELGPGGIPMPPGGYSWNTVNPVTGTPFSAEEMRGIEAGPPQPGWYVQEKYMEEVEAPASSELSKILLTLSQDAWANSGVDSRVLFSGTPQDIIAAAEQLNNQGWLPEQGQEILNNMTSMADFDEAGAELKMGPYAKTEETETETETRGGVGLVSSDEFNLALDAIRKAQAGDATAALPDNVINAALRGGENNPAVTLMEQFTNAQARQMPYGRVVEERKEELEQFEKVDLPTMEIQAGLDRIGLQEEGANYRAQIDFAGTAMQIDSQERMQNVQVRSNEAIALASNQSNEFIAEVSANASRDVAQINGLSSQTVALINTRGAAEVAEITGMNQQEVERIKGEIQLQIADASNLSAKQVANIQSDSQYKVAALGYSSSANVTTLNNLSAEKIAGWSDSTSVQIAEIQAAAQTEIAKQNRLTETEVAEIIYEPDNIQKQFEDWEAREEIKQDYLKELSQAIDISEEALAISPTGIAKNMEQYIAEMNNKAQKDLQDAQLEFEKTKYQAELTAQGSIDSAQLQRLQTQFMEGYETPQQYQAALLERERGGLDETEFQSLQKILASGGLTAEERLTEIQSETRSAEMNSLLSLLSNPQALGAFVTILTGEIPFEAVPTMGELTEMTPSRIEYLQGALSALGIDPQTFIRMAQDVTPQAFQETGPFGQLSAMIA